jgi:hypothetical protein
VTKVWRCLPAAAGFHSGHRRAGWRGTFTACRSPPGCGAQIMRSGQRSRSAAQGRRPSAEVGLKHTHQVSLCNRIRAGLKLASMASLIASCPTAEPGPTEQGGILSVVMESDSTSAAGMARGRCYAATGAWRRSLPLVAEGTQCGLGLGPVGQMYAASPQSDLN